jgi:putative membrane protein
LSWNILLHDWNFEPTVVVPLCVAALVYWLGDRSFRRNALSRQPGGDAFASVQSHDTRSRPWWRAECFYGGLIVVFIALQSPVDWFDGQLFWVHMLQHLVLIMVAAPLIILGDPIMPYIRAWPLWPRRRALKLLTRQSWSQTAGRLIGWIASPWVAAIIFIADLYLWHWALLFNLTLQNQFIHDLEHVCFLGTALLFWSMVIDQRPVHLRMSYGERAVYLIVVGAADNMLAMFFVFATRPLYSQYASLSPRPFGMGAMLDQQLAGALMWVPVLFVFGIAIAVCLYKWLGADEGMGQDMPIPAYRLLDGSLSTDVRHGT